jgi:hypothetical protein
MTWDDEPAKEKEKGKKRKKRKFDSLSIRIVESSVVGVK